MFSEVNRAAVVISVCQMGQMRPREGVALPEDTQQVIDGAEPSTQASWLGGPQLSCCCSRLSHLSRAVLTACQLQEGRVCPRCPLTVSGLSTSVPWPDMPASQWIVTVWGGLVLAGLCHSRPPLSWYVVADL